MVVAEFLYAALRVVRRELTQQVGNDSAVYIG